ncbi:rod shape-determining protein MreD [Acinetobacter larvae]|uniref:Rod shape-determining protein MreD n=1 Tax=Acinetobacter larvae TaxID=1789224 RepID=A0A1B2LXI4_9GAMM|nr:rod shape-determining protein MreD [Acinetobacter larvae]AOA57599.1 rod shape-determining protein MreD [Acinetobacter larvae]
MLIAKKLSGHKPQRDPLFVIIVSIIIASVLVVYPLSYAIAGWRPLFMFVVMLFWILCQPTWCGVWFSFTIGIYADLLLDAPLGMNALSYVMIAFIIRYLIREKRVLTFNNLWVIVMIAIAAHLLLTLLMQAMAGMNFSITRHWQPLLSSILLWPLVYYCLKRWRI